MSAIGSPHCRDTHPPSTFAGEAPVPSLCGHLLCPFGPMLTWVSLSMALSSHAHVLTQSTKMAMLPHGSSLFLPLASSPVVSCSLAYGVTMKCVLSLYSRSAPPPTPHTHKHTYVDVVLVGLFFLFVRRVGGNPIAVSQSLSALEQQQAERKDSQRMTHSTSSLERKSSNGSAAVKPHLANRELMSVHVSKNRGSSMGMK
jgi:hypothetical protein